MDFLLSKNNLQTLKILAPLAGRIKIKKVNIMYDKKNITKFSELMPALYKILDQELFFEIWLQDFPYCVVSPDARDHILPNKKSSEEKVGICKKCYWQKGCSGFPAGYLNKHGVEEVCPVSDLPDEIMLEIEPKCNFKCQFCFNKISFAKDNRSIEKLRPADIKKILKHIADKGIKIVRFTGGEPMLNKDFFSLAQYAKSLDLEVRLNTNGSLIDKNSAAKMKSVIDNVLIPIESYTNKKEERIAGYKNSLINKFKAIKYLRSAGIPIIRIGTVATRDVIENFSKISKLILSLPIDEWEFYRPISGISKKHEIDKVLVKKLTDRIITFQLKTEIKLMIANALPFCLLKDKNRLNAISSGAIFDDGHRRMVVDPRGFVKPHYFIDKNIGSPFDIIKAWNHPFMKKMRGLKFLPKICEECNFKHKCCGGSRYSAKIYFNKWNSPDPILK